jgi:uncharacterized secreted protein with C-terminal beta-propeller domain
MKKQEVREINDPNEILSEIQNSPNKLNSFSVSNQQTSKILKKRKISSYGMSLHNIGNNKVID